MTSAKVSKSNYEVVSFNSGYYGIAKKDTNKSELVWGGDSADEDCHDKELAFSIFENWDGTLNQDGKIEF